MKRQVHARLPTTSNDAAAAMIRKTSAELPKSSPKASPIKTIPPRQPDSSSSSFRKHNSVEGSRALSTPNMNQVLSKAATFDTGLPFRSASKPIRRTPSRTDQQSSAGAGKQEQKALYHTVSADLLSKSPLQPSPSMTLLEKAAEVLVGDHAGMGMRRMPVQTTSQVFEVRKPPGPAPRLGRQESLLAVFKPATDEEDSLLMKSETSFRFNPEERALRERAAYVLDKAYSGFSRVPATALARVQNSKGSLQEYVRSEGNAEDHPELVGRASIEEVQRIAVLDCRIFNLDRHSGNVLVSTELKQEVKQQQQVEDESFFEFGEELSADGKARCEEEIILTPIDHSLSLPPWTKLDAAWFDWTYWPQADSELTDSTRRHILSLNRAGDEAALLELGIRPECVATNAICTIALKSLVRLTPNLTLKAIGSFFQRPYSVGHRMHDDVLSPLENIVNEACIKAGITKEDTYPGPAFFLAFESVLDDQIKSGDWMSYLV